MKKYYLFINGETVGPMFLSDISAHGATPQTHIWYPGLKDWIRIAELPEIADALQQQQEPQPPLFNPEQFLSQTGSPSTAGFRQFPPSNDLFPRPNNYLAESIVALLFCFPFAIVAIIKAVKVNKLYDRGEVDQSYIAANEARNWFIAAVALGLFLLLLTLFA